MKTSNHEETVDAFRAAMGSVCTPVAVITAMDGARPHGTTVSAFASLSMSPPSLLVSLDQGSELLGLILGSGRFGVNVLGSGDSALATRFARKGQDKFSGVDWRVDADLPRLDGVPHWIAAEVMETSAVADHIVVFGRVITVESASVPPLTYHERVFGTHAAL